jgi:DNA-binding IclR family transcriptional regulator
MAAMTPADVDDYIAAHCQTKFTALTRTDRKTILEEIEQVRGNGYSLSVGEYYAGNTVAVAPIFSPNDDVCRGICLIGFTSQVPAEDMPLLGEKVRATAQMITQGLGG